MRFKDTIGISHIFKTTEHELCRQIGMELEAVGLTLPQYVALSCLEEKGQATNADLARKSEVTPQTMIRIMQNLERDGFVLKVPNPEHGLKQDFALKPKAEKVLCDAHTLVMKVEAAMLKGFTKKEISQLDEVLSRCLQNLRVEE